MKAAEARNTSQYAGDYLTLPVKAGATIHAGTLVAIDATGHAISATKAADITAAGRAEETADNTGGADGAVLLKVRRGVFKWDNDAATPITQADVGKTCYMLDDQTVTASSDASSAAGKVLGIDLDGGVIVETN